MNNFFRKYTFLFVLLTSGLVLSDTALLFIGLLNGSQLAAAVAHEADAAEQEEGKEEAQKEEESFKDDKYHSDLNKLRLASLQSLLAWFHDVQPLTSLHPASIETPPPELG